MIKRPPSVALPLLAILLLALQGCTTETWYQGFQQSSENRCRNQPPGESQRCLDDLNRKTYSEYEKERKKERSGQKQ
ncbi:MAG TPA: hypothetical protein VK165_16105 [Azonexus sp.]|nr:hypothetical protein [Azonexus sp.]